jgi:hypothetical protein
VAALTQAEVPVAEKPRYFSIVVFDIDRPGPRIDPVPEALVERAFALVDDALTASGIPVDMVHVDHHGDGGFVLVGNNVPKCDIGESFVRKLNDGLHRYTYLSAPASRLRLRVALHAGDVARDDQGWEGAELETAFRLVDSPALHAALTAADKAHMAVIVSWTWYDAVVWHQRGGIDRTTYSRVPLDPRQHHTTAWVHVPGYLTPPVSGWPDPAVPAPRTRPGARRRHARPAR